MSGDREWIMVVGKSPQMVIRKEMIKFDEPTFGGRQSLTK